MSIVIASAALIASDQAVAIAKETACKLQLSTYNAAEATVQQMKEYSSCVHLLHPDDMTSPERLVAKLLILIMFLGAGVGVYLNRNAGCPIEGPVVGALLGFCVTSIGLLLLGGFLCAVQFLFS